MSARSRIQVTSTRPESPHNAALNKAGEALIVDSVTAGRDFCRSMITVCCSAIPLHIVLVGLVVGRSYRPTLLEGIILLAGPGAFLAGATCFAYGLLPIRAAFSLDLPEEVEWVRDRLLQRRGKMGVLGFAAFCLGTMLSIGGVTYALAQGLGR